MKITSAVPPFVCRNMTTNELIRAAEHAFPRPSPIVALMLEHLKLHPRRIDAPNARESSSCAEDGALNCPSCGAGLHITNEDGQ